MILKSVLGNDKAFYKESSHRGREQIKSMGTNCIDGRKVERTERIEGQEERK